ncbi:DUF4097 domain-containing protein [Amycolatopsis acidiphila]|uniref:DUF4097 domain-containing protein n=1 Tax=Amycolatopsis acidiphila TaxID=715473 RepID=A0A558AGR3_9PSEU|nr:DUF4097 family beta strand repeat-containing protein [Amycolatopsis acidiphila]TVT23460.1 DUF4097 domain-containing protein [Amycolatopsis acidiphila]UIJ59916.1 DUF4097 domain-containing protein [Amycolatopsis acidiphila]GHG62452.1 lipoprotein [Amycolatopsis acidiphila]
MGRTALAIGGLVLISAGIAIGVGWWWPSTAEADHQVAGPVAGVRLDTASGDVRITARDVGTTSIHERFHYNGSRPDAAYRLDGTQLVLAGCGHDCIVDYEVVVPRGATVSGSSKSGDLLLEGVLGTDVTSNSGNVRVEDAAGPVRAHANSGDIEIGLASPQDVHADANSGDVTLTVPSDRYRVQARTNSGDQEIDVATDPAGPHLLDLEANSGDVKVRHA